MSVGQFAAVTRSRFADHAYNVLFHKIVTGEIGEGDPLPTENELCALFEISGRWFGMRSSGFGSRA